MLKAILTSLKPFQFTQSLLSKLLFIQQHPDSTFIFKEASMQGFALINTGVIGDS